ncbi:MAG TPA: hypothetical protein VGW75_09990 [Solirubrobacteraceae bacterium]|jgi:hypothetical protein|nr:hypothetical protein [Solirubrobacteraceae bacterium]
MRSRRQRRIEDLRLAVECLPERTKVAMLEGIAQNTIIVGAYADRRGGVCPMLAAHRHGGRTSLLAFAKAWDRFCNAKRPRVATERELAILRTHLESSLMGITREDLGAAIAGHQAAARERRALEAAELGLGWTAAEPREARDVREPELV